ncbi:g10073 [Coccomyxa elongata]
MGMECECHTSAPDGLPAIWPVELHQAEQLSKLPMGLCLMGLISSAMWSIYAMTTLNLFIAIPNLLGGLLSAASLLVCCVFLRSRVETPVQQDQARARTAAAAVELG